MGWCRPIQRLGNSCSPVCCCRYGYPSWSAITHGSPCFRQAESRMRFCCTGAGWIGPCRWCAIRSASCWAWCITCCLMPSCLSTPRWPASKARCRKSRDRSAPIAVRPSSVCSCRYPAPDWPPARSSPRSCRWASI